VGFTEKRPFNFKPFFIMLCSALYIQTAGKLFFVEIIFFISLPFLGWKYLKEEKRIWNCVKLLFLILLAEVLSDLYRHSSLAQMLKGISLILFTIINLVSIHKLVKSRRDSLYSATLGWVVSSIIAFYIQPNIYAANFWKFGFAYPITIIIMIWSSTNSKNYLLSLKSLVILVILIGIDFFLGARSLGAVTLVTVVVHYFNSYVSKKNKPSSFLKGIFLMLIIVTCTFSLYSLLASRGVLGLANTGIYQYQTRSPLGLLISGRNEVISEYYAIKDSPIIGHGTYAPLTPKIRDETILALHQNLIDLPITSLSDGTQGQIPVHSGIFQFWVWFGLAGTPFFFYILFLALQTIRKPEIPIIFRYFSILLIWDVFFSPFGFQARIGYPIAILFISLALQNETGLPTLKQENFI
jgi:hypothetical protein